MSIDDFQNGQIENAMPPITHNTDYAKVAPGYLSLPGIYSQAFRICAAHLAKSEMDGWHDFRDGDEHFTTGIRGKLFGLADQRRHV